MYEICNFLAAPKKPRKASAPRKPSLKTGMSVQIHGLDCVISHRDARYPNAWFVVGHEHSYSRDMILAK